MGKVYLVGAGPGDPGLLTIKGLECTRRADVIIYDRLIDPSLLKEAPSQAELIYVGKASDAHTVKQDDINRLLVEKAREGKTVVRLKGGDPFVFGRGGEEAEILAEEGIEFEVIPGVTSAIAVPAYAGIPVTHRSYCSTLGIITGREDPKKIESSIKWDKIATGIDTIVFLMGVKNLPNIVAELIKNGRDVSTPIALIRWGTGTSQETLLGTLDNIVEKVKSAGFKSPAVIIVGEVVKLREKLRWFDNRPLFGKKILVTRSRDQASRLSEMLCEYGAELIEFPILKILPPESFEGMDKALNHIEDYDWLLFTSSNGMRALVQRLWQLGRDIRWLKGPKIGAIDPKTAGVIRSFGVNVNFIPSKFATEAVVREFPEDLKGKSILFPLAGEAQDVLPEKLIAQGALVDVVIAYRTEIEESDVLKIKDLLDRGEIDVVTFTSSSTVRIFVELIGEGEKISLPEGVKVACIGPITAQEATEHGLKPDVVSDQQSIESLISAIAVAFNGRKEQLKIEPTEA